SIPQAPVSWASFQNTAVSVEEAEAQPVLLG
ncbi:hypothetical protein GX50_08029, partial [[Emmonsia] crescens]